ncbi:MAG: di-trans,poly-cis-decaprenylcistransferase [Rhodospirillaceae bacterium]|nr:di-trans,poly-cis-decaprenylcistransferase [Rhodospirillaceae bacterium]MCA8931235.1 di-trans,poly-cis-decaprenylcistransferase [Rhodospirillaceae bacterium]
MSAAPPRHIAIIMDGNGRWARARGLPRHFGHRKGVEALRRTIEAAADLGIANLTLFGFSTENWRRPASEVKELLGLMRRYLSSHVAELCENDIRLRVIGERQGFSRDLASLIERAEELTRDNRRLVLTVALNYGARRELTLAVTQLVQEAAATGQAPVIDEAAISARLFTHDLPDPDLVIRSSGEQRLSNFLLWQSAYSELVFVDTLWPDFGRADLEYALSEYGRRDRRYGAVVSGE